MKICVTSIQMVKIIHICELFRNGFVTILPWGGAKRWCACGTTRALLKEVLAVSVVFWYLDY